MSTRTKILVVDDEKAVSITLALVFKSKGFEAQSANSGMEALELARSFRPDILLTDVMMPGMDGFELAEEVFNELPGCRVFLLSGAAQTIAVERITNLKMGALLIAKPIAPPTLLNIVSSNSLPPTDFQPKVLVVDDYEPHRYSLGRMLENAGFKVVQAATGEECLQKAKDVDVILLDIRHFQTSVVWRSASGFAPKQTRERFRLFTTRLLTTKTRRKRNPGLPERTNTLVFQLTRHG